MSIRQIPLDQFDAELGSLTEVSSAAIGATILDVSDEFFAPASDLLLVPPAPSLKGQFGPQGALFSGWESRRHNPDHDWVIIELGPPSAFLRGFDIDTAWFTGNHAPAASVEGIYSPEKAPFNDSEWISILPSHPLTPSSRHLFALPTSSPSTPAFTHLRLRMYPDGGIARFRAYGVVAPIRGVVHPWDARPDDAAAEGAVPGEMDLAHAFNGGRSVFESDKHYGVGANLLLPGRGVDMGDGWETKRSRTPGHCDFVIIKLGAKGTINAVDFDTSHFKGNYPAGLELHAIDHSSELLPLEVGASSGWVSLIPRKKVGPHAHHVFPVEGGQGQVFTHVRMTMYPDGGVKRLRVYGVPSDEEEAPANAALSPSVALSDPPRKDHILHLIAEPLTPDAFAPYGQVIDAAPRSSSSSSSVAVTSANGGTASKSHRLAVPLSTYPEGLGAVTAVSCFRCVPPAGFGGEPGWKGVWPARMWERHPYNNQTFIPMGKSTLPRGGEGMLVIVALPSTPSSSFDSYLTPTGCGTPDPRTIRAFLASPSQGLTYDVGVWHHSVLTLVPTDFACVETQIATDGSRAEDCEVLTRRPDQAPFYTVEIK